MFFFSHIFPLGLQKCDVYSKYHFKKVKNFYPCIDIHLSLLVVPVCHSVSVFDWIKSHPYEIMVFLYLINLFVLRPWMSFLKSCVDTEYSVAQVLGMGICLGVCV